MLAAIYNILVTISLAHEDLRYQSAGLFQVDDIRDSAYASSKNQIYRFGGRDNSDILNNGLSHVDFRKLTWISESVIGDIPTPRMGSSLSSIGDDNYLVLFGGCTSQGASNDVYLFDKSSTTAWFLVLTMTGKKPTPRCFHSASSDGGGGVFISGGVDDRGNTNDEIWLLDFSDFLVNRIWGYQAVEITNLQPRIGRSFVNHQSVLVEHELLFFNSVDSSVERHSRCIVESVDLRLRVPVFAIATGDCPPSHLKGSGLISVGRIVYLIGGCSRSKLLGLVCHEQVTWRYDTTESLWSRLSVGPNFPRMKFHMHRKTVNELFLMPAERMSDNGDHRIDTKVSHIVYEIRILARICNRDCLNSGTCSNGICVCLDYYFGPDCQYSNPWGERRRCNGHGEVVNARYCDCYLGFYGSMCQYGVVNQCLNGCSGRGQCNSKSQCICASGWGGVDCSVDQRGCLRNCCGNGQCIASRCICDQNEYVGLSCAIQYNQMELFKIYANETINYLESNSGSPADIDRAYSAYHSGPFSIENYFDIELNQTSGICQAIVRSLTGRISTRCICFSVSEIDEVSGITKPKLPGDSVETGFTSSLQLNMDVNKFQKSIAETGRLRENYNEQNILGPNDFWGRIPSSEARNTEHQVEYFDRSAQRERIPIWIRFIGMVITIVCCVETFKYGKKRRR